MTTERRPASELSHLRGPSLRAKLRRGLSLLALVALVTGPGGAAPAFAQASAGADSSIMTGAGLSAIPVWGGRPNEEVEGSHNIYFSDPAGDPRALWLQGEQPLRLMSFYLPEPGISAARLQLSLRNGSDVLPPDPDKDVLGSRITVTVNDNLVGVVPSVPHTQTQRLVFDIPAEYFKTGENKIQFTADHRHRLYCSIVSTFDLWTEINPRESFLTVTPSDRPALPTLSRLGEIFTSSYTAEEPLLMLRADGNITGALLEAGSLVAQSYGVHVGQQAPMVESRLAPRGAGGAGDFPNLDLSQIDSSKTVLYGTADAVAGYVSPSISNAITGPFVGVYEVALDDPRTIVVVSGRTEEELVRAALELREPSRLPAAQSTVAALEAPLLPPAPSDVRPVLPRSTMTLADLGMQDVRFDGVRRVDKIAFSLPSDYYPGQGEPVVLRLTGSYSNVGPDGQILVRLNDEFQDPDDPNVVSAIALEENGTHDLVERAVQIPAAAFQPGINILTVEAQLPPHNPKDCTDIRSSDVGPNGGGGGLRYTLDAGSTLTFPEFVAQARMPNLATTATTAFPLTRVQDPAVEPGLYVPNPTDNTLSATYVLTAKLAQQARQVVQYFGTTSVPERENADVLVVAPRASLSAESFEGAPISATDISGAFSRLPPTLLTPVRSRATPEAAEQPEGTAATPEVPQTQAAAQAQQDFLVALDRAAGGTGPTPEQLAEQAETEQERRAAERERQRQQESDDRTRAAERSRQAEAAREASARARENPTLVTRLYRRTKAFLLNERPEGTEDLPIGSNPMEGRNGQTSVVMQYPSPSAEGGTWTVFTSASDAVAPVDAQRLVQANYWGRLRGDAMAFGGAPGSISRRAPDSTYTVRTGAYGAREVADTIIGSAFGPSRYEWFLYMLLAVFGFAFVTWSATKVIGQNAGRADA